ncbi:MAG: hypothetical protein ACXAC5_05435 [Promethearchaeota archaeon]
MDYEYDKDGNSKTPDGVDWKIIEYYESPDKVLDIINEMLSKHNLEVVQMDHGGTFCEFSIVEKNR